MNETTVKALTNTKLITGTAGAVLGLGLMAVQAGGLVKKALRDRKNKEEVAETTVEEKK